MSRKINTKKIDKEKEFDKDLGNIKNKLQAVLFGLSHPRIYVPVIIIVIIILSFVTIKGSYKDGHWVWEKKEIKVKESLDKLEKIKETFSK